MENDFVFTLLPVVQSALKSFHVILPPFEDYVVGTCTWSCVAPTFGKMCAVMFKTFMSDKYHACASEKS